MIRISARPGVWLLTALALLGGLAPARALLVEELDNGLKVVVQEQHVAPVAAFRIYVRAGGIYEQEFLGKGLTHVLEHLLCAGATTTHTEEQSKELVQAMGGALNAYTTTGHTCYHINTSADKIGAAITLVGDWVENSTIQDPQYTRELGVVMEELRKGLEEPQRVLHKAFNETMFQVHPVRVPVIGYEELVSKISRDDVLTYYHRMYVPNNLIVVAVGDFDEQQIMAQIKTAFAHYPRRPTPAIALPAEPPQVAPRERTIYREGIGGAYGQIGFHSVPIQSPDLYPLDVLSYILSNGRSSRLEQKLVEQLHLVAEIDTYSETPEYDAGVFGIAFSGPDDKMDAARAAIWTELQRVCDEPVTAEELAKAKTQKVADEVRGKQTAEAIASDLGANYLFTGDPEFGKRYVAGINQVTAAEVQRVARTYFKLNNMTTVMLRPAKPAAATATQAPATAASKVRAVTLPNGLRVLVKRNPGVGVVAVQASFWGGVRLEPADQNGVSRAAASLWSRGTATHSALAIATAFDRMGGSVGGASGNNSLGLSMEVLAGDFAQAWELYTDMLVNPAVPEKELATVKGRMLDAITRKQDDWQSELDQKFRQTFFSQHPYGHDVLGTKESVSALTVAQVQAFFQARVTPSQGVIAIYGDITEDEAIAAVTAKLGGWQRATAPATAPAAQVPVTADTTKLFPTDRKISGVMLAYPGLKITDTQDGYAMGVLQAVLTGVGYQGGRLEDALRGGDRNLVYQVAGIDFPGIEPGYFAVLAACSPEKMDTVIAAIQQHIDQMRTTAVPADELAKAKAVCVTMERLSRQTSAATAQQAVLDELYGLGYAHSDEYEAKVAAVTAAEVQRVAQKYFTHFVLVRTGPPGAPAK